MERHCITELEIRRRIKSNRSGGFPLILYILMIWWGLMALFMPVSAVVEAAEAGEEHPILALFKWEMLAVVLAGVLAGLLFRYWLRLRKENRPQGFVMRFGYCTERKFTDMEDRSYHTITAKTDDGDFGQVNVSQDTYDSIGEGTELYVLVNSNKEITDLWKAKTNYLEKAAYYRLSPEDRVRESEKRAQMENTPQMEAPDPEFDAHSRGKLTEDDLRRIRFAWIVRGVMHLIVFLIGCLVKESGVMFIGAFALVILIGIILESDHGADCAFIGKAWQECREKLDTADPEILEQAIRRKMKGRRLRLAGLIAAISVLFVLLSILGGVMHSRNLSMGSMLVAAAYLLLGIRRAIEALARRPTNPEQDMLARLLRK